MKPAKVSLQKSISSFSLTSLSLTFSIKAFIEKVKDKDVSEKELIDFCRETLAGFKIPKKVEFCELPKTSTGKIQKFELRKKAKEIS